MEARVMKVEEVLKRILNQVGPSIHNVCAQMVKCPCHDDLGRSLIVSAGFEGIRMRCQKGCKEDALCAAMGIAKEDLAEEPAIELGPSSEGEFRYRTKPSFMESFPYIDEAGHERFHVHRSNYTDFWFGRLDDDGGGIHWIEKPCPLFLFNLPAIKAADPDEPIFVVESEPDVERLTRECLIATCNPKGAGNWRPEYAEPLRGKRAAVVPNNDLRGLAHAAEVRASLQGLAKAAVILELPGAQPHANISDWFGEGGTPGHLLELAKMGLWIADGRPSVE